MSLSVRFAGVLSKLPVKLHTCEDTKMNDLVDGGLIALAVLLVIVLFKTVGA